MKINEVATAAKDRDHWRGILRAANPFYYPRDAMLARVIAIATCLSVRLSVRLSDTRRYCVKTKKASGMISSPSDSPKTLVFCRQIFITKF